MQITIGILAKRHEVSPPFGAQTVFFEEMVRETQNLPVDILVFSPEGWRKDQFEINAFSFEESGWVCTKVDIPKIIYDRFISETHEEESIKLFRQFLKTNNFHLSTPLDLVKLLSNKLKFYEFLRDAELPTVNSVLLRDISEETIKHFLNDGKAVYLKPISGLKGNGIAVLEQKSSNLYILHFKSEEVIHATDINLIETLKNRFDPDSYIVQPKAKVADFNDSPFDVRVLVQNHGNKNYLVTGMGVRIGKINSWVTNLSSGSKAISIYELREFYQDRYERDVDSEVSNIESICLECCQKLHEKFGNFSEIGIDVLLTLDQGPVILEGNSKPGRWIFNQIANSYLSNSEDFVKYKAIRSASVKLPVRFILNNKF